MALTPEQQAVELISRAKQILLIAPEHATVDHLSSIAAAGELLKALHKNFDAVVSQFDTKTLPSFLRSIEIRPSLGAIRAFHVQLKVSQTPVEELSYDVKDGLLDVTIVPKQGEWTPQDLTFKSGQDRYDLVIAFGSPDLASLGAPARDQAGFFYRTPIINIDCRSTNEHWGQLNLVRLTAVSVTEVLYAWMKEWNKNLINKEMATAMLAGMISETKGFRTTDVTPATLAASSELMSLGADRQGIVHALWRTRTVNVLKLWGRALSRLEQDRDTGLVWSVLADADFVESGAVPAELEGIVDELIAFAPEAKVVVLIAQTKNETIVRLHAEPPYSAAELVRPFGGYGTRERAIFPVTGGPSLVESTAHVIERLKEMLSAIK